MEQPKHQIIAETFLINAYAILLFWTLEGQIFWRYANQKIAHEIPEFRVSTNKITKQLVVTHIVFEGGCRSTIRTETFPMLLLSKEDAKREIVKTEQFIKRGPEYQMQYVVEMEGKRFLCVAFSKTSQDLAKAFVIKGSLASRDERRYIDNVKYDKWADGGTVAVYANDESEGITLSLDIPSPLLSDLPALILDRQEERIVKVYYSEDLELMRFELLSNEEKRGTAQFTNLAAWI